MITSNLKKSRKAILTAALLVLGLCAYAQQLAVKGSVLDEAGEPIIGAYITLEGNNSVGTITDFDGNFEISVDAKSKLLVSYTGYESQTIAVAGKSQIDVVLREISTHLDEVVAIGYGSQKAKEITSSVASVKAENFNPGVKESPMGLLQGKVAGLTITRTEGGDPTKTGFNVQIRGTSTLDKGSGTTPLYIVDGIPVTSIDNIAPEEIASMDVLKDGSSAAIYGTRGTNGVIMITTKRGTGSGNVAECGTTNVEYSGYASFAIDASKQQMATADQFLEMQSMTNGKCKASDKGYKTDWVSAQMRDFALTHNHNLAISGATKNFSYRGSVNFKNAEGIANTSNRQEIMAKLAANQKALQGWLDLQYDFSYMHYKNDYFCGSFDNGAIMNPTMPIYNEDGSYYIPTGTVTSNPIADNNLKESYQDGNYFRGSVKASVNIKPVPGLKVSGFGAFEEGDNYDYWSNSKKYYKASDANLAGRKTKRSMNQLYEGTIDYVNEWNGHALAAVLGTSYQNFWYDGSEIENGGFAVDGIKYYKIGDGDVEKTNMKMSSYRNSNTLVSFFARANYNYKEKYLLSASVRREGSSRMGANFKWGWFPAASAGWRISGEDFLKDVKAVNDLKLRFGFGITGNNLKDDLKSVELLTQGGTFNNHGTEAYSYTVNQNANPNLAWERKFEYNLGIDYAFLDNRLYGSIDLYFRNTKDLLWEYNVPTPPYQYST
nr:SusC/RagA family TonB-linked outer membrane protein [Candidatus Enterocola sp.]